METIGELSDEPFSRGRHSGFTGTLFILITVLYVPISSNPLFF